MPLNALGYLNAAAGKRGDAERYYKEALALDPNMLVARHNLAVLLAERRDRADEAIGLWRENLSKDPTHLPSRLSLARVLAEQGKSADAVTEYERVIKDKPDYVAARVALGTLQAKAGQRDAALVHLREAVRLQPGSPEDRKSTRLNSSHSQISYAVFCLKKKKTPKRRDVHPPDRHVP